MSAVSFPVDADSEVKQIADLLKRYGALHPRAAIDVRRSSPASVHVRVIDPDFASQNRTVREDQVWPLLEELPDDVFTQITVLLLLTPEETASSYANLVYFGPPESNALGD